MGRPPCALASLQQLRPLYTSFGNMMLAAYYLWQHDACLQQNSCAVGVVSVGSHLVVDAFHGVRQVTCTQVGQRASADRAVDTTHCSECCSQCTACAPPPCFAGPTPALKSADLRLTCRERCEVPGKPMTACTVPASVPMSVDAATVYTHPAAVDSRQTCALSWSQLVR